LHQHAAFAPIYLRKRGADQPIGAVSAPAVEPTQE
jgi:hypothetical protein